MLAVCCVTGALCQTNTPTPSRIKRADAFLGIHFDFHAGPDCTNVGVHTTPDMVQAILDKVRPDYIQVDCKGHPGYSSYPTRAGKPVPGFVGDPLRVWRDVTRRRGTALFMHYSGVWDAHAVTTHPDWAVRHADGSPDTQAASVFGPYADRLLIPQLRELAGFYGVDGAWVDGDCWGVKLDYGEAVVREFCKKTGAAAAPRKSTEPFWPEWLEFNREGFRHYLRHYVNALKSSHPGFDLISNWSFSDHMPEPVSADVAALSGDFSPDDSVNSARFTARTFENQGRAWDLMSWSFTREPRHQKPAVQLMQEAAIVLALGGGYQAYFTQNRDGSVRLGELDVMAEVARFCRARQPLCHHSTAVPQVALLYSSAAHYRSSDRPFSPWDSDGMGTLRNALTVLLTNQYSVQIVSEHHMKGRMSEWPLIIVPGWGYLEPGFKDSLASYAKTGGSLLLVGSGPAKLFASELAASNPKIASASGVNESFPATVKQLFPTPTVSVSGASGVDVTLRRHNGRLAVHLVNTQGPHAHPPAEGIAAIPPTGPLTVTLRLPRAPKAIMLRPEGQRLPVAWAAGRAEVTIPQLELYSILEVTE